ncbi:Glyoxylase, beta-lactamase superfamily II [Belliella buryatensis]|uniref:Glyoxylase, beta-lactamase superfamily II n=1 Tax=Belliella buryatensis TaxID=1500549 RepID=A0A239AFS8_9BACT|nr:MBL fold metallo-hydrolase [Belliella buryatensis]SNR94536.1 Glyoxylase, beta-lactamase superfamily II [Belliella buryatensis]
MHQIHIIDLIFLETEEAIASFLIETTVGPILIETGPNTTFGQLKLGIEKVGYKLEDIQHVLLSHIHFDHAGAAWEFANRGAKIYVHPVGLPHLNSPEKLWNSAAQIYGDDMDKLWGKMEPIDKSLLYAVSHEEVFEFGNVTFQALHTPGHAVHHIAWRLNDVIFTGDVGGVKINNGPVVPPCPPPDIHIENWKKSIALIKSQEPKLLYLTHFGIVTDIESHLESLEALIDDWANWMKPYFEQAKTPQEIIPAFMEYTKSQLVSKGVSNETMQVYEYANPSWMSVAGLLRYWKLKNQGRI